MRAVKEGSAFQTEVSADYFSRRPTLVKAGLDPAAAVGRSRGGNAAHETRSSGCCPGADRLRFEIIFSFLLRDMSCSWSPTLHTLILNEGRAAQSGDEQVLIDLLRNVYLPHEGHAVLFGVQRVLL